MRLTPVDVAETSPSGREYLRRAREFAARLAAAAPLVDARREVPPGLAAELAERGFYHLLAPRSLGGAELPPLDFIQIIEEIAKADASTAWCLNQTAGCSMTAAYLDPQAAREIFAPPRGILAWGPGPGEAHVVPGGYRLTASFAFASGSHNASWLGAHVPVVEADGTARRKADGSPAIRVFMFPKEKARMRDIWHVMGLRGTGSDEYEVEDLFVPEAHTAARDDKSTRREEGLLYRFSSLQLYASGFACVAMGIARAALDSFTGLARDKVPFRAAGALRESHVVQSQVAQAEARLGAARSFLFRSLGEITEEVARRGELSLEERMRIRLAATFAIHQSVEVVDTCYHAAGSTAIFDENPFERRLRDIHTMAQQLQGRQSHYETVGQYLLGLEPETLMWL
jgi:alkylation response protein AidB-like acyl-CoA dehydrogenase